MDSEWESERQKKHERVWRKRKSYGLLSTFLHHPPFLQAQTIATLCHCERAGGHCLCFSIGRLRCIPRGSSQPIGSQGGRAAVQLVPKNVSAIDLFPGWALLSSHFPKNSLFYPPFSTVSVLSIRLLSPFTSPSASPPFSHFPSCRLRPPSPLSAPLSSCFLRVAAGST